jgi:DNA-nicking Smr family endonuclease
MPSRFKVEEGNWTRHRALPNHVELDLHTYQRREFGVSFDQVMWETHCQVLKFIEKAQLAGRQYVLIIHGHSTSRPGRTSKRSVVRDLMRSKEATPFIIRKECIQDHAVFIVAIRPLPKSK